MRKINTDLMRQFSEFLTTRGIAKNEHYHYQKWLRYYLDFCHKYQFIEADPDSLEKTVVGS